MDARLDGIEIKATVGAEQVQVARHALALSGGDGRRRRIYFCEDVAGAHGPAALPLLDNGIILRLRQNKGSKDDSTVKLRPFDQARLTPRWRHARTRDGWEFKVEGDWVGDRHVVAASLVADQDQVQEVGRGQAPPRRAFSAEQEQFLSDCARVRVDLDGLRVLGPVDAVRWKDVRLGGFEAVAEQWDVDRGALRFLELSILVDPAQAVEAQRSFTDLIAAKGLESDTRQETKTRMVLEHLADLGRSSSHQPA
jgi:hypothetical protein